MMECVDPRDGTGLAVVIVAVEMPERSCRAACPDCRKLTRVPTLQGKVPAGLIKKAFHDQRPLLCSNRPHAGP